MGVAYQDTIGGSLGSLMVGLYHLFEGDEPCYFCEQPALFGIATGSDPDLTACCYSHAMNYVTLAANVAGKFAGLTTGTEGDT